jgi:polyhydroxybutyrate depolymerase
VERIKLSTDQLRRDYLLFRSRQPQAPLVVFLHGTGATAAWADDETGWSRLAAREGFVLAVPEALRPDPASPPKFLTNPQRWNDGSPTAAMGLPKADDVAFLAGVIDDVQARARIDPARIFVSGFSNGAAMAFRVAEELANRIAAVAPIAGYCWVPNPKPARAIPTFYLIGSLDPLVPLRGGDVRSPWQHRYVRRPPVAETLERWATALGCASTPRTESDNEGVRTDVYPGPVPFQVVTIEGLGHHWPGGKGGFNPRIAGPTSDRVNATELVWDFFQHHGL